MDHRLRPGPRERLEERAAELGACFKGRLEALAHRFPAIGEVRGLGLMLGVELVGRDGLPAADLADEVLENLKDDGLLAGKCGAERNVLAFQPPLVIERHDIDEAVDKLGRALARAGERTGSRAVAASVG